MVVETQLREEIRRALRGVIAFEDLYDWLVARTWNMDRTSTPRAVELATQVERLFWDPEIGPDEDRLRRALSGLLAGGV
jgi:hypothetical protein